MNIYEMLNKHICFSDFLGFMKTCLCQYLQKSCIEKEVLMSPNFIGNQNHYSW